MKIGVASADYVRSDRSEDGQDHWGGSGWARLGQYLPFMRAAGHDVIVGTLWQEDDCLSIERADGSKDYPDVILLQRLMHEGLPAAILMGKAAGQVIINDLDDWYWGLSTANAAFKASHPKFNKEENTLFYRRILSASSHITVSTPYLADRVSDWTKVPMEVIPNYVDVSRFTPWPVRYQERPLVGWAGSTAHRSGDIQILRGVLPTMRGNGSILLHHSGHHPDAPSFSDELMGAHATVDIVDSTLPLTDAEHYPELLKFDIGVIPLADVPFNEAKSDIKGLEYAAAGIPFVASASQAYRSLWQDWHGSLAGFFTAKNPVQWRQRLYQMLQESLRADLSHFLLENVKQRDIAIGADRLLDFIESVAP